MTIPPFLLYSQKKGYEQDEMDGRSRGIRLVMYICITSVAEK